MRKLITIFTLVFAAFLFVKPDATVLAQEDPIDCGLEEDEKLGNEEAWEAIDAVSDGIENTPNGGQNAAKLSGKSSMGFVRLLGSSMCTCCYKGSENIPEEYGMGLLEKTNEGVIAMMNRQPTVNVFAHLAEEWVPGYSDSSSVYANGYQDLMNSGINQIWTITRNVAYACYVVIMIVIGFMIMFRNKIGGQMMVTLGNSLPKIIISLILVTFSFAIIGIIIDVAGVARNIIAAIYYPEAAIPKNAGIDVTNNPIAFALDFKNQDVGIEEGMNIMQIAMRVIKNTFSIEGIIKNILSPIIMFFVFFGAVKLWIMLLKSYLGILVNVVLSPLSILFGALPGNEASMINTFKSALRNALAFPLAYAIVNLPYILEDRGLSLGFPDTLTGDQGKYPTWFATLIIEVVKIIAIFTASSAPDILKGVIPATAPKSGIDIGRSMKENMSKIPLLGGMFK